MSKLRLTIQDGATVQTAGGAVYSQVQRCTENSKLYFGILIVRDEYDGTSDVDRGTLGERYQFHINAVMAVLHDEQ